MSATPEEHAERVTRAEREARNAAKLRDHPHIVAVHDVVVENTASPTLCEVVELWANEL